MRIASLVHNGVLNDARVIKEAMTLRKAGYEIVIHGISPDEHAKHHILPGTDIEVFLEPRAARRAPLPSRPPKSNTLLLRTTVMWPLQLLVLVLVATIVYKCALQLASFTAIYGHESTVAVVLAAGAVGGVGFMRLRPILWRLVSGELKRRQRVRAAKLEAARSASRISAGARVGDEFYRLTEALLASLQRQPLPDAIHLHDHVALVLADKLKELYGLPIVWDAHEIYQELAGSNPERAQANAAIIAAKLPFVDYFITINDSIARYYQSNYPRMPSPHVVMNATVLEPVPVYDGCLHEAAQLPRDQKILLFQGGFSAHRGLQQLVQASGSLPDTWTLVMMGWGALEVELRGIASDHPRAGAVPAIVFLPGVPQHELQQWSAGATLGVIPYENTSLNHLYCTPNKLWEYPNAGVPVLCSDLIEMSSMIKHYRFGFLLPREFTIADIVSIVRDLSQEALTLARDNCAHFVAANNWSVWEHNLLAVYAALRNARQFGANRAFDSNAV